MATGQERDTRLDYNEITKNLYIKPAKPNIDEACKDSECLCRASDKCDEDCLNRDSKIECGENCVCDDECKNKNFERGTQLKLIRIENEKGYGVACEELIPARSFIIEFVAEVVTKEEMSRRLDIYEAEGKTITYLMDFVGSNMMDATEKGNLARFINHACEPNAICEKWTVEGETRLGIFSVDEIKAGDEITIHYGLKAREKTPTKCLCKPNCPNFLWEKIEAGSEESASNETSNESEKSSSIFPEKGKEPESSPKESPEKGAESESATSASISPGKVSEPESEHENSKSSSNESATSSSSQGPLTQEDMPKMSGLSISGKDL